LVFGGGDGGVGRDMCGTGVGVWEVVEATRNSVILLKYYHHDSIYKSRKDT